MASMGKVTCTFWDTVSFFIPLRVPFSANTSNDVTVSCSKPEAPDLLWSTAHASLMID